MSLRRSAVPIAGLLASLLIAGCRTPSMPIVEGAQTPLPIDDARAERVLGAYLEQVEARSALRGSARVLLEGPDFKLDRPQRIVVERPARFRFEVIGLFDQLAALLVSNGRRFGFYEASNGRISRGWVTPSLLWELARIDLEAREVVGLLLGAPAPSPGIARAAVWLESEGQRITLAFAWPEDGAGPGCQGATDRGLVDPECFVSSAALAAGGEVFSFDEAGRLVEMRALDADGLIRFRATFEQYEPLVGDETGLEFPQRVTIRSSAVDSVARFVWKRIMLVEELSDRLFTIPERRASDRDG